MIAWLIYFAQVNARSRQQWTGIYKENTDSTENLLKVRQSPGKRVIPHPPLFCSVSNVFSRVVHSWIKLAKVFLFILFFLQFWVGVWILNYTKTWAVRNIFKQQNSILRLTFNPGLALSGFRTIRTSVSGLCLLESDQKLDVVPRSLALF